ncbi:hypothetical protein KNCP2_04120 [Candidatus Rickettsia kedanie]|uniref:Uncharacterized protein n=1 Tax=Candidatus Rickettsia kedanie TaxID=3115352 RepID=A0ABP9TWZ0_9RICK
MSGNNISKGVDNQIIQNILDKNMFINLKWQIDNRPLQKFAYREEFGGDTECSTAAYINVKMRVPDRRTNYL